MPSSLASAAEALAALSSLVTVAVLVAGLVEERAGVRAWRDAVRHLGGSSADVRIAAPAAVARDARVA
jgi:hypothetical protein